MDVTADIVRLTEFDSAAQEHEIKYEVAVSGDANVLESGETLVVALPIGDSAQGFKLNCQYGKLVGLKVECDSEDYDIYLCESDPSLSGFNAIDVLVEVTDINMLYTDFDLNAIYVAPDNNLYLRITLPEASSGSGAAEVDSTGTITIRLFVEKMYSPYESDIFERR